MPGEIIVTSPPTPSIVSTRYCLLIGAGVLCSFLAEVYLRRLWERRRRLRKLHRQEPPKKALSGTECVDTVALKEPSIVAVPETKEHVSVTPTRQPYINSFEVTTGSLQREGEEVVNLLSSLVSYRSPPFTDYELFSKESLVIRTTRDFLIQNSTV